MTINSYEFSEVYDILMNDVPYDRWVDFLDTELKNKRNILEIGCGTGEITKRLGDRNYKITAVDLSENMLVKAYEKLRTMSNIRIMKGDGRNITIDKKFDAVVSTCDVINYLLDIEDLRKYLNNSYKLLNEDGKLIFDISSYYKLKNILGSNTFVHEEKGIFYAWENIFDVKKEFLEMSINFFIEEEGIYRRVTELQKQRAYKEDKIVAELEKIGFKDIKIYDDYKHSKPRKKTERIVFCATRR